VTLPAVPEGVNPANVEVESRVNAAASLLDHATHGRIEPAVAIRGAIDLLIVAHGWATVPAEMAARVR
jgi:hypothetical protein